MQADVRCPAAPFVRQRHDDEQVHIGVFVGRAVGVGAEQDNALRAELLGDFVDDAEDLRSLNHTAIVPCKRAAEEGHS